MTVAIKEVETLGLVQDSSLCISNGTGSRTEVSGPFFKLLERMLILSVFITGI